jgi:hypothetical protein
VYLSAYMHSIVVLPLFVQLGQLVHGITVNKGVIGRVLGEHVGALDSNQRAILPPLSNVTRHARSNAAILAVLEGCL